LLRFGAIVSRGILEAGGRNCTISLVHNERVRMLPLIGISIFSQFWYWFNNILFITYALEPTPIIGLNAQCMMPESFKIISTNKPSTYAYPQNFKKEEKKVTERIQTATLSLATRSKRGQIDKFSLMPKKEAKAPPKVEQKKEEEKKEESKEPEPLMEIKNNGTRVLVKQRNFIQLMINSRYVPVKYVQY
jgi:26S proteasome regulatory subunit N2